MDAGDRQLVLLLHGFPESWYSWRHQLLALSDAGYRAVAISGRGYGRSSRPYAAAEYRITELVSDCVGVVESLGHTSALIVGHDWGAQVAWASAWMRPDVFPAVAALGVAFGGRTLLTLPGYSEDALQEGRPSEISRVISGPDLTFYRDYLVTPGVAEREMEKDIRGWLRDAYFTYSGSAPRPAELEERVLADLDEGEIRGLVRNGPGCIVPGRDWRERFHEAPDPFPEWLGEDVLDFYVAEFERTGMSGAVNWYRNPDLNWELLAPFAEKSIQVPALYIEGDRDPATMLLKDRIEKMTDKVPYLTTRVIAGCGHWIGEERPEETNEALLDFLASVCTGAPRGPRRPYALTGGYR